MSSPKISKILIWKKLYHASIDNQEAKIWLELAELGQKGAFNSNKTFTKLAEFNG